MLLNELVLFLAVFYCSDKNSENNIKDLDESNNQEQVKSEKLQDQNIGICGEDEKMTGSYFFMECEDTTIKRKEDKRQKSVDYVQQGSLDTLMKKFPTMGKFLVVKSTLGNKKITNAEDSWQIEEKEYTDVSSENEEESLESIRDQSSEENQKTCEEKSIILSEIVKKKGKKKWKNLFIRNDKHNSYELKYDKEDCDKPYVEEKLSEAFPNSGMITEKQGNSSVKLTKYEEIPEVNSSVLDNQKNISENEQEIKRITSELLQGSSKQTLLESDSCSESSKESDRKKKWHFSFKRNGSDILRSFRRKKVTGEDSSDNLKTQSLDRSVKQKQSFKMPSVGLGKQRDKKETSSKTDGARHLLDSENDKTNDTESTENDKTNDIQSTENKPTTIDSENDKTNDTESTENKPATIDTENDKSNDTESTENKPATIKKIRLRKKKSQKQRNFFRSSVGRYSPALTEKMDIKNQTKVETLTNVADMVEKMTQEEELSGDVLLRTPSSSSQTSRNYRNSYLEAVSETTECSNKPQKKEIPDKPSQEPVNFPKRSKKTTGKSSNSALSPESPKDVFIKFFTSGKSAHLIPKSPTSVDVCGRFDMDESSDSQSMDHKKIESDKDLSEKSHVDFVDQTPPNHSKEEVKLEKASSYQQKDNDRTRYDLLESQGSTDHEPSSGSQKSEDSCDSVGYQGIPKQFLKSSREKNGSKGQDVFENSNSSDCYETGSIFLDRTISTKFEHNEEDGFSNGTLSDIEEIDEDQFDMVSDCEDSERLEMLQTLPKVYDYLDESDVLNL
ncbi:hypothetical protein M153_2200046284 [Pseudoloma neurophilia]|uniref:Uncharacterized protein n=1 Tax=Pseudoloma neurophilia TaxID=146866 RepID=A0A0R0M185_9MICR|nr:hypothetical protein M153_2200046284 [Pseudoloma neurophilia]